MVGKYKVITLCGSTKFKDAYLRVQKDLTLQGNIVISVGLFGHSGDDEVWTEGTKAMPPSTRDTAMIIGMVAGMPAGVVAARDIAARSGMNRGQLHRVAVASSGFTEAVRVIDPPAFRVALALSSVSPVTGICRGITFTLHLAV